MAPPKQRASRQSRAKLCILAILSLITLSLAGCTLAGSHAATTPAVTVNVIPASSSVQTGHTQQFTATVSGSSNTAVTWSATGGSVSSSGLYTAPSTAGTFTVIATSVADNTTSASAKVTVSTASAVSVTISPISVSMLTSGTQQFNATVSGSSNTAVTWSATGGSVSSSGLYTAPSTAGSFTVKATSATDNAASASAAVTVTDGAVPSVSYNARTDLNVAPETVPPVCSPAPCSMTSSDLNPNVSYTRVTDVNTLPSYSDQFGTINSIENDWSIDGSGFVVANLAGSVVPFEFSPGTATTSTIPCTFSGSLCTNGVVNLPLSEAAYSWVTPNVIYSWVGSQLTSYDLRGTISNPATAPTVTVLNDASTCPNMPTGGTNGSTLIANGNYNDTRWANAMGGAQNSMWVVYVYDSSLGCRFLRTDTMTIYGQWGTTGPIVYHDGNGNVIPTVTYSDMHGGQIDKTGRWVLFDSEVTNSNYQDLWDISTNNVYQCSTQTGPCIGHGVWGFDNIFIFTENDSSNVLSEITFPPANNYVNLYLDSSGYVPSGFGDYAYDSHESWNQAQSGNLLPIISLPYSTSAPTVAWVDEIVAFSTDGTNVTWRFAHAYTRAHDYNAQGLPNVSHDGKWAIFGSDWGGTTRDDVFLIPLR